MSLQTTLTDLFNQGYQFCKRLPSNAPDADRTPDDVPAYMYKGDEAVAVYEDGRQVEFKPEYKA